MSITCHSTQTKLKTAMVYAGGTISSLMTSGGYREGGHVIDFASKLQERFPDFTSQYEVIATKVAYTGLSENIDLDYLCDIANAVREVLKTNPQSIILTHGTDSMEQTAEFLQNELEELLKEKGTKITLTGADKDLSCSDTDAWANLGFAFESTRSKTDPGVYVAFHGKFIPAHLVVKEPFNGIEMNYTSKSDRGYLDAVWEQDRKSNELISKLHSTLDSSPDELSKVIEYQVNIFRPSHKEFVDYVKQNKTKAVLLVLYHSGTANTEKPDLSIASLVKKLREELGVVFFAVTENGEPIDLHSYETSVKLREAGVVPLYDMKKAVALAKLNLVTCDSTSESIDRMLANVAGEIDESRIIKTDIEELKRLYGQR